ncbi:MAG: SDR family oxidoreductase [Halioglobus sp.]
MAKQKLTAMVTGASAGLGEAFCRALANECDVIIAVARREDRLLALAKELEGLVEVHPIQADLTTVVGLTRAVEALRQLGPVDYLVNNAGFGTTGPFAASDLEQELEMVRIHIDAPLVLTRAALPFMRELGGGNIINVSSVAGFLAVNQLAVYGAAKSFISAWSLSLQEEVRSDNIQVQLLCPGYTRTEFHDRDSFSAFDKSQVPQDVWMDAETVVATSLAALESGQQVVVPGEHNVQAAHAGLAAFSELVQ